MNSLIWLAVLLLVAWVVLRVMLAMTGFALHLLWIAAVLVFLGWLFQRVVRHT